MNQSPIHPAEYIVETRHDRDMSANELALALDIPTNRITEIVHGCRGITADIASRLDRWLESGAEGWMNIQKTWELRCVGAEHSGAFEQTVRSRALMTTCELSAPG